MAINVFSSKSTKNVHVKFKVKFKYWIFMYQENWWICNLYNIIDNIYYPPPDPSNIMDHTNTKDKSTKEVPASTSKVRTILGRLCSQTIIPQEQLQKECVPGKHDFSFRSNYSSQLTLPIFIPCLYKQKVNR